MARSSARGRYHRPRLWLLIVSVTLLFRSPTAGRHLIPATASAGGPRDVVQPEAAARQLQRSDTSARVRGSLVRAYEQQAARRRAAGSTRLRSAGGAGSIVSSAVGITYHWGSVLGGPTPLYIFWLGNFTDAQKGIVRNFIASLNPQTDPNFTVSKWWNINRAYEDWTGQAVTPYLWIQGEHSADTVPQLYPGSGSVSHLYGSSSVWNILASIIQSGEWKSDPNAVYILFTDDHIVQHGQPGNEQTSFCSDYCGWHWSQWPPQESSTRKYIWLGNAGTMPQCQYGCLPRHFTRTYPFVSPQGDPGIEAAVSILAHELAEAASDPNLDAWFTNPDGWENADLCIWAYGDTLSVTLPGGSNASYNLVGVNGTKFLVQLNWDPTTGACVAQRPYPPSPPAPPSPILPPPPPPPPPLRRLTPSGAPPRQPGGGVPPSPPSAGTRPPPPPANLLLRPMPPSPPPGGPWGKKSSPPGPAGKPRVVNNAPPTVQAPLPPSPSLAPPTVPSPAPKSPFSPPPYRKDGGKQSTVLPPPSRPTGGQRH